MLAQPIRVTTSDPALGRALEAHLQSRPGRLEGELSEAGRRGLSVVVAPTRDVSPAYCTDLVAAGSIVVILAAVPREHERMAYLRAGAAAYVPMSLDPGSLVTEVGLAIEHALQRKG
ncbi:MAG: hypothetical protein ACM3S1_02475 [Hyphomicrobiales bacterium]